MHNPWYNMGTYTSLSMYAYAKLSSTCLHACKSSTHANYITPYHGETYVQLVSTKQHLLWPCIIVTYCIGHTSANTLVHSYWRSEHIHVHVCGYTSHMNLMQCVNMDIPAVPGCTVMVPWRKVMVPFNTPTSIRRVSGDSENVTSVSTKPATAGEEVNIKCLHCTHRTY